MERATPSIPQIINTIVGLVALIGAALSVGYYFFKLDGVVDELSKEVTPLKAQVDALERKVNESDSGLASTRTAVGQIERELGVVNGGLSELQSTSLGHASRVSTVENEVSNVLAYLASRTFDTVYRFKHTFNFPNVTLDIFRDGAKYLACPSQNQQEIVALDDSTEFIFYTGSSALDIRIREEILCYERRRDTNRDIRISPTPVQIEMEMFSDGDGEDSGESLVKKNLGFDHDTDGPSDLKVYPIRRNRATHGDRQTHTLSATPSIRTESQERCGTDSIGAPTGELHHCDFEVVVFAYDSLPPSREE